MAGASVFSRFRDPVSGLTHLFAAVAAKVGLVVLIVLSWGRLNQLISTAVYGVSLVLLFAASATYHLVKAKPEVIARLRKLDHAAIFLLIAGTYTPFCMAFNGFWRWGLLSIIWSLALLGIVLKMFAMNAPRWISAGVYLVMGWLCIAAVGEMLRVLPPGAIAWLVAGGVLYSVGAVIYVTKAFNFLPNVFGFHEVWHLFVMLAAASHYVAIAFYVVPLA